MEATTADAPSGERYASGGPGKGLFAPNLALAFKATVDRLVDDEAIIWYDGEERKAASWTEAAERVRQYAGGFAKLGIAKGDTVAMMTNNRPEFVRGRHGDRLPRRSPVLDYQTSSPDQIKYVVGDAGRRSQSSRLRSSKSSTRRARSCRRSSTDRS